VGNAPFDKYLFGFSDQKTKKMRMFIKLERDALETLSSSLQADDRPMILKGVRPNYAKLFKMFGDFEAVMK
jgi:hypothetical protein